MFGTAALCGGTDLGGSAGLLNTSLYTPDLHLATGVNIPVEAADDNLCPSTDIDGDPRPTGGHCDVGADERTP